MYETTSSALDGQATVTQSTIRWKRSIPSAVPQYHRVAYVPPNAAVILGYHELPIDRASNGSEPAHVASRMQMLKRQQVQPYTSPISTPDSLVGWPACLVSQACVQVATGVSATTISTFIPTSTAVVTQTTTETYATASCVAPAEDPAYTAFTPIWGAWNGDSMDPNNPNGGAYMVEAAIQLPFSICLGGYCSSVLTVGTDGYVYYNDDATSTQVYLSIYSGQGFGMYVYPYNNGIFYRVAGTPGARSVVISWYTGTYAEGYEQNHYTITLYENVGVAQYKYYGCDREPESGYATRLRLHHHQWCQLLELRTSPAELKLATRGAPFAYFYTLQEW
ncbi:hypothetical protein LTR17_005399 [Elasticomyces elasticus]|nr:hypothetical protein LTR17_005399 [Elasticomyces elasticus]